MNEESDPESPSLSSTKCNLPLSKQPLVQTMAAHHFNAIALLKWLALLLMIIFVAAIAYPGVKYVWQHRPMDAATLFANRCIGCHQLPALERTRDWHWDGVVASMRYLHGADRIISEEEAERITEYLSNQHQAQWANARQGENTDGKQQ